MSVGKYLEENGYRNVAEWAMSSGYVYHDDTDLWHDEDGYLVDPYQQLLGAIETALENSERTYNVVFAVSVTVTASDEYDAENIAYEQLVADGWTPELLARLANFQADEII